ncbi:uncharacterized protein si:dkey-15j16.6 isoform X2 [Danio rerio]|uniref:Si:dkey-15j16.6 n=1 Tax=Danio rerio TaxID=7955 RepID=E7F755_DANRE|nr:uncharacterized protein si:dkey-15j16.6 [Danio rerio]|eukprot:XP_021324299.1 uncharacterized protein si:dkey-15j16.6 [Danio rerio]
MKSGSFFLFMLQLSTGCILTDEKQTKTISGYSGGSVLLPCSCAQPQSTIHTFSWQFYSSDTRWIQVLEDQKYRGRVTLFNHISPTNLSLLISGLRKEDGGYYSCMSTPNLVYFNLAVLETPHMPISMPKQDVIVPARPISPRYIPQQTPMINLPRQDARPVFPQYTQQCDLVNKESKTGVTGYSGESVVLPCWCTNLLSRPEHIQWMYWTENGYKEIYPNEEVESHKNRVKLLNQNTPGNLSLLISALTIKHQGTYYCTVLPQQHVYFTLNVKEKPQVYPTSSSTHRSSHQTQELPPPQQTHHTPLYVFILVAVFTSVVLLAFLALSTRYAKTAVANSAAVYVETAPIPAHRRNDQAERTVYVNSSATHT